MKTKKWSVVTALLVLLVVFSTIGFSKATEVGLRETGHTEMMTGEKSRASDIALLEKNKKTMSNRGLSLSTESIDGTSFSQAEFEKYDLTMVNVFTTWCTACVQEIPDLEKLHQDMKGKGVNVIGIVADAVDETDSAGKVIENKDVVGLAKKLREKTGATYLFLKPDAALYNGYLKHIYALPDTFFVDKKGNVVGETYSGSHDYEEWKKITEKTLKLVKGA